MRRMIIVAVLAAAGLPGCKRESRSPLLDAARACTAKGSDLSCPRPIFSVRDLRASTRYFHDVLGFHVDWEYGEPPDFASVSRGDAVIFMCMGCQGSPGAWTMMFSPDVDRLHDELRRRKAIIQMPPTDMPWHVREMRVADPDGNVLRIGTGIDHD
ncbi:MAG TPA: glyoxalase superfamily protein [Kofleriaceae bacterium]|nr:glyoxalase superfamily protein [Kofleriaceae bacterium]